MKWWRIIWTMYVLVLSVLPCEAFCLDESIPATDQASAPTAEDHSPEKGCSPFCLCATCPGFTVPQPPQWIAVALPTVAFVVAVLPCYQAPQGVEVPGRIWQPPRLS